MASLNLITSNPVTDAFDKRVALQNQQETQDLQNATARQSLDENAQLFPSRLSEINSLADLYGTRAKVEAGKAPYDIQNAQTSAAQGQENLRHSQVADPLLEAGDEADLSTKQSQNRVQISTEGAQVSKANNDAIEAAARAKVAQNGAKYDMEGRWIDLLSKNPEAAIAQAPQYGVPPELVAIAKDQNKAAWLKSTWDYLGSRYPNANDAATRAAIFDTELNLSGDNPSASSAMQVPVGAPPPTTRLDELRSLAAQYGLAPGSRGYAQFITSDGKTIPPEVDPLWKTAAAQARKQLSGGESAITFNQLPPDQQNYQVDQLTRTIYAQLKGGPGAPPVAAPAPASAGSSDPGLVTRVWNYFTGSGTPSAPAGLQGSGKQGDPWMARGQGDIDWFKQNAPKGSLISIGGQTYTHQ